MRDLACAAHTSPHVRMICARRASHRLRNRRGTGNAYDDGACGK